VARAGIERRPFCEGLLLFSGRNSTANQAVVAVWDRAFVVRPKESTHADLPRDVPLFIARAGLGEMPHLNDAIDRFLLQALRANLPVTLVNHHTGPHAFDIVHESDASREIIARTLTFMRCHLLSAITP